MNGGVSGCMYGQSETLGAIYAARSVSALDRGGRLDGGVILRCRILHVGSTQNFALKGGFTRGRREICDPLEGRCVWACDLRG